MSDKFTTKHPYKTMSLMIIFGSATLSLALPIGVILKRGWETKFS